MPLTYDPNSDFIWSYARGSYPKEILALGSREYREVYFKPYRIIYRIKGDLVYVLLIVDGRRDMKAVLQRRLLDPTRPFPLGGTDLETRSHVPQWHPIV